MSSIVEIKDLGFNALVDGVRYLSKHAVEVGMMANHDRDGKYGDPMRQSLEDDGSINDEMTVAEVFIAHELGIGVPKRPSLTTVIDSERPQIERGMHKAVNKMIGTKPISGRQAYDDIADVVIELTQDEILSNINPPLSFARVQQKQEHGKSAQPALIMHRRMFESFTSKQVTKNG